MSPPVERELKFPVAEVEAVRRQLRSAGAEQVRDEGFECNWVFDRNDELRSEHRLLRLRTDPTGRRLTVKGKASFDGHTKVREEIEIEVSDFELTCQLLSFLGYEPVTRYEKYREEWSLDGCSVVVDRTPIGRFVEFEGSAPAGVAARCGFDPQSAERRSYLQLYDDLRVERPELPPDMVFGSVGSTEAPPRDSG